LALTKNFSLNDINSIRVNLQKFFQTAKTTNMNFTYSLFIMLMACQVILGQDCEPKGKKCKKLEGECVTDCKPDKTLKCKETLCKGGEGCACKYTKEKKPVICEQGDKCDELEGTCESMKICKKNKKKGSKCDKKACKGNACGCSYSPKSKPPAASDDDSNDCEQSVLLLCDELEGSCVSVKECKALKIDGFKCNKDACTGKKCGCSYFPKSKPPAASDDDSKPVGSDDESKAPAANDKDDD